jgi:hypothetical protein
MTRIHACHLREVDLSIGIHFIGAGVTVAQTAAHLHLAQFPVDFQVVLPQPVESKDHVLLPEVHHSEGCVF